ncbi:rod-binding protein [Chachezhania antarctica]|uniref:rod-binding protein n=1 Tax=Chachezhania antarctica TaxID=2340860 RepID=UPI003B846BAC
MQPVAGAKPRAMSDETAGTQAMRDAAIELEATFLAEMLKSAGLHETSETFGGGVGEDQFSSLLVREQARAIARAGGIGLAETFFQSMMEAENGH